MDRRDNYIVPTDKEMQKLHRMVKRYHKRVTMQQQCDELNKAWAQLRKAMRELVEQLARPLADWLERRLRRGKD